MERDNENLRFECAFSEKAINNNKLTGKIFILFIIILVCFVMYTSDITKLNLWFSFSLTIITVLLSLYSMMYVRKLAKGSYLEITSDGILKCVFKGRKELIYPINEIKAIEQATIKDVEKKYATFPIALDRWNELYPPEGVLITFNRAWIKSIFPVFFNPVDIEGFISAIRTRIKQQIS